MSLEQRYTKLIVVSKDDLDENNYFEFILTPQDNEAIYLSKPLRIQLHLSKQAITPSHEVRISNEFFSNAERDEDGNRPGSRMLILNLIQKERVEPNVSYLPENKGVIVVPFDKREPTEPSSEIGSESFDSDTERYLGEGNVQFIKDAMDEWIKVEEDQEIAYEKAQRLEQQNEDDLITALNEEEGSLGDAALGTGEEDKKTLKLDEKTSVTIGQDEILLKQIPNECIVLKDTVSKIIKVHLSIDVETDQEGCYTITLDDGMVLKFSEDKLPANGYEYFDTETGIEGDYDTEEFSGTVHFKVSDGEESVVEVEEVEKVQNVEVAQPKDQTGCCNCF